MNRKQRRAAARGKRVKGGYLIGAPDVINGLDFHCPDCNSELHHWTDDLGIQHVDVLHDDTCPTWKGMQK